MNASLCKWLDATKLEYPDADQLQAAFDRSLECFNHYRNDSRYNSWGGDGTIFINCFLRDRYSWALPSKQALEAVVKVYIDSRCSSIVDIGSGSGYWLARLQARTRKVVAIDDYSWHLNREVGKLWVKPTFSTIDDIILTNKSLYLAIYPAFSLTKFVAEAPVGTVLAICAPVAACGFYIKNDYALLAKYWSLEDIVPVAKFREPAAGVIEESGFDENLLIFKKSATSVDNGNLAERYAALSKQILMFKGLR